MNDLDTALARIRAAGQQPERRPARWGWFGQALRGLAESGYSTGIGVAALSGAVQRLPGVRQMAELGARIGGGEEGLDEYRSAVRDTPANLAQDREEMREFYGDPETGGQTAALIGGNMLGSAAQFMIPGAGASRASQGMGFAGRLAVNTAAAAPLTVAQSQDRESSTTAMLADLTAPRPNLTSQITGEQPRSWLQRMADNPAGRAVGDVALDAVAGGALEGVARGVGAGVRGARGILDDARAAGRAAAGVEDVGFQRRNIDSMTPESAPPRRPGAPREPEERTIFDLPGGPELAVAATRVDPSTYAQRGARVAGDGGVSAAGLRPPSPQRIPAGPAGIRKLMDQIGEPELPYRSERLIQDFVGHARNTEAESGLMIQDPLERAVSTGASEFQQIEAAFQPVRDRLRREFGPTVKLYRAQRPLSGNEPRREVLSWTSDPKFAKYHAGGQPEVWQVRSQAAEYEGEYDAVKEANGGAYAWSGAKGRKKAEAAAERLRQLFPDIEVEKAVDEVPGFPILEREVPLEDVVWYTNRAGQDEFLVRNRPDDDLYGRLARAQETGEPMLKGADRPRFIPAVRTHEGRVFQGSSHYDAVTAADKAGAWDIDQGGAHGFLDPEGNFISRVESGGFDSADIPARVRAQIIGREVLPGDRGGFTTTPVAAGVTGAGLGGAVGAAADDENPSRGALLGALAGAGLAGGGARAAERVVRGRAPLRQWEVSGADIPPVYHGSPDFRGKPDAGRTKRPVYGHGFHVSQRREVSERYGPQVLEFRFQPEAKILEGASTPDAAHPELLADVLSWAREARPDGVNVENIAGREGDPFAWDWKRAQDAYADAKGFDALRINPQEIIVKNTDMLVRSDPRSGFAQQALVNSLTRVGAGAAMGGVGDALVGDDKSPLEGALVGAGAGVLHGGTGERLWSRLQQAGDGVADAVWSRSPTAGRLFFINHPLPQDYRSARSALRRGLNEARMVAGEVHVATKGYAPAVQKLLSQVVDEGADPEEVARRLSTVLDNPEQVDEAARVVAEMHDLFGGLGREMVDVGLLGEESLKKYGGRYLPRYYRAADEVADELDPNADVLQFVASRGRKLDSNALGRTAARSDEVSPEMAARRVEHFGFRATTGALQEKRLVAGTRFLQAVRGMDDVVHAPHRDIADELAAAKAARDAASDADDTTGFREANAEVRRLRAEEQAYAAAAKQQGFVQLPDKAEYGAVRGLYVTREVADDLKGMRKEEVLAGSLIDAYDKWLRVWKLGKTVLNPATHARNVYGSQILSWMGGGPTPFGSTYRRAVKLTLAARDPRRMPAALRGVYDEARAQGLFDGSYIRNDLEQPLFNKGYVTNAPTDADALAAGVREATGEGRSMPRRAFDKVAEAYHNEDVASRLAHYMHKRDKGLSPERAATEAKSWVPMHEDVPEYVRIWSRFVPFFGYTAAALPRVAEAAVTRPVRFLAAGAAMAALGELVFGDDRVPDEIMPPDLRSGPLRQLLPTKVPLAKGEGGERAYLDMTYSMPWGDLGENRGEDPLLGGVPGFLNPFTSNPLLRFGGEWVGNRDYLTGRELFRASDRASDRAKILLDRAYKQALPSLAPGLPGPIDGGWSWEKMRDALTGKQNRRGETRSVPATAADVFLGLKTREVDPSREFGYRLDELEREERALKSELNYTLRDRGASREAKEEARGRYRERVRQIRGRRRDLHRARATMRRGQAPSAAPPVAADPLVEALEKMRQGQQ